MGPGQNFLTWIGLGQFFVARARSGRVSHPWLGFGKFLLKHQFFQFFTFGSKKSLWVRSERMQVKGGSSSYLLLVKSKLKSGRVKAHLY